MRRKSLAKFCTTCGKPLQYENAEICPSCGMKIQSPTAENTAKNPIPLKSTIDPAEKNKHYQMELFAIGIALFYFIISGLTNSVNEILSFVAFILLIVGVISIIRRQILNR
jgi:uncharacterized membrane protein YvbJ